MMLCPPYILIPKASEDEKSTPCHSLGTVHPVTMYQPIPNYLPRPLAPTAQHWRCNLLSCPDSDRAPASPAAALGFLCHRAQLTPLTQSHNLQQPQHRRGPKPKQQGLCKERWRSTHQTTRTTPGFFASQSLSPLPEPAALSTRGS